MTKMERIRALIGNLKNWDWTVYPQYPVEKEDAEAMQDLQAIKEYVKEKEKYGGNESIHNRQDKESAEEQDNGDIKAP